MKKNTTEVTPVAPSGMEIIFLYKCPKCQKSIGLVAPTQPAMAQCEFCGTMFPVLPVDERGVQYVKLMMGNGLSAMDLDFY